MITAATIKIESYDDALTILALPISNVSSLL